MRDGFHGHMSLDRSPWRRSSVCVSQELKTVSVCVVVSDVGTGAGVGGTVTTVVGAGPGCRLLTLFCLRFVDSLITAPNMVTFTAY
jgi:hypothetical protein